MYHKTLPKEIRHQVYNKYNGHCAYCGCELEYKAMQVDHIVSVYLADYNGEKVDDSIDNFNPSCRACNFYKSSLPIEAFRERLTDTAFHNLRKNFNYKLLIQYGLLKENIHPVKFYFEKEQE